MAWTVDRRTLEKDRDRWVADLERRRSTSTLETAARARLWVDEVELARSEFAEAVEDQRRRLADRDRTPDSDTLARWGGLLRLAGRDEESRLLLQQSLAVLREDVVPHIGADIRYLIGDDEGALAMIARSEPDQPFPPVLAALVQARAGDPARLEWAREQIVRLIREDKLLPSMGDGEFPLALYDWLEETFRLEGEPVPAHLEMLERAGLLVG